jgi:hypothetical protein
MVGLDLMNLAPSQDGLPSTDRQAKPRLAQDPARSGVVVNPSSHVSRATPT